jgi:hypothetical protein
MHSGTAREQAHPDCTVAGSRIHGRPHGTRHEPLPSYPSTRVPDNSEKSNKHKDGIGKVYHPGKIVSLENVTCDYSLLLLFVLSLMC